MTFKTLRVSLRPSAIVSASFHKDASHKRSYRSSGTFTGSMYRRISLCGRFPLMAARAKGLYPIGGLRLSIIARRLLHCSLSAKALTRTCQNRFSEIRNLRESFSASCKSRCCSREPLGVPAYFSTAFMVDITEELGGATSGAPYLLRSVSSSKSPELDNHQLRRRETYGL